MFKCVPILCLVIGYVFYFLYWILFRRVCSGLCTFWKVYNLLFYGLFDLMLWGFADWPLRNCFFWHTLRFSYCLALELLIAYWYLVTCLAVHGMLILKIACTLGVWSDVWWFSLLFFLDLGNLPLNDHPHSWSTLSNFWKHTLFNCTVRFWVMGTVPFGGCRVNLCCWVNIIFRETIYDKQFFLLLFCYKKGMWYSLGVLINDPPGFFYYVIERKRDIFFIYLCTDLLFMP